MTCPAQRYVRGSRGGTPGLLPASYFSAPSWSLPFLGIPTDFEPGVTDPEGKLTLTMAAGTKSAGESTGQRRHHAFELLPWRIQATCIHLACGIQGSWEPSLQVRGLSPWSQWCILNQVEVRDHSHPGGCLSFYITGHDQVQPEHVVALKEKS